MSLAISSEPSCEPIVVHLVLDGGDISDRLEESLRVVPMHPLEGGELDVLRTTPGPASTDHLGFVEADDGFGQSVIVRVASAADGRLNARLGEPLGVTGRDVSFSRNFS